MSQCTWLSEPHSLILCSARFHRHKVHCNANKVPRAVPMDDFANTDEEKMNEWYAHAGKGILGI